MQTRRRIHPEVANRKTPPHASTDPQLYAQTELHNCFHTNPVCRQVADQNQLNFLGEQQ
jgi:hypothetical protein